MEELPNELLLRLLSFIDPSSILKMDLSSSRFHDLIRKNRNLLRKFNSDQIRILLGHFELALLPPTNIGQTRRKISFKIRQPNVTDCCFPFDEDVPGLHLVINDNPLDRRNWTISSPIGCRRAVSYVVKKISKYFTFESAKLSSVSNLDFYDMILPSVYDGAVEGPLMATLPATGIQELQIGFGQIPSPNLCITFFKGNCIRNLRTLSTNTESHGTSDLDDEMLFNLRLRSLNLHQARTQVTVAGAAAVLNDWRAGHRNIERLSICILKTREDERSSDVLDALGPGKKEFNVRANGTVLAYLFIQNAHNVFLRIHEPDHQETHWKLWIMQQNHK